MLSKSVVQSFIAEFICSSLFGLVVFMSIIISKSNPDVSVFLVGQTIGFSAIVLIYSFMDICPAHFNPAITLTTIILNQLPVMEGFFYILAQLSGMTLSIYIISLMVPLSLQNILEKLSICRVSDSVSDFNIFATEFVLTFIITFVAFSVAINNKKDPVRTVRPDAEVLDKSYVFPVPIGLVIFILVVLGSLSTGGYFNPALVFAPTILNIYNSPSFDSIAYMIAQFSGSLLAGFFQCFILNK